MAIDKSTESAYAAVSGPTALNDEASANTLHLRMPPTYNCDVTASGESSRNLQTAVHLRTSR